LGADDPPSLCFGVASWPAVAFAPRPSSGLWPPSPVPTGEGQAGFADAGADGVAQGIGQGGGAVISHDQWPIANLVIGIGSLAMAKGGDDKPNTPFSNIISFGPVPA